MRRSIPCLVVLSLLWLGRPAIAGDCHSDLGRTLACTRCAATPCCCPDNYCRKPLPCAPCPALGIAADCYCPKPLPCIKPWCGPRCPDTYCRKPFPQFCWPVAKEFYRCPPCPMKPERSDCR